MAIDDARSVREVARIDDPTATPGHVAGHRARRFFDGWDTAIIDPFLIMAEDWMRRGGYERHPHRDMETVTFVIEGAVEHFDSAGHRGLIAAGDAQWMTAGRGVEHTEDPAPGERARTLQLWVNLPAAAKMTPPRYQDLVADQMPIDRQHGVVVRVFSGKHGKVAAPTLNHVPVAMLELRMEAGASFRHRLPSGDNAFLLVLAGAVAVGGERTRIPADQLAWLTRSDEPGSSEIRLHAEDAGTRVLLFAGAPLREPVAFGGPFVMNTPAEIQQAFADYRQGRF